MCKRCCRDLPAGEFYATVTDACKECHDKRVLNNRRDHPAGYLHAVTRRSAKRRGLEYALDVSWFEERLQTGRCAITGIPFGRILSRDPYCPSPDRVDNTHGYTPTNTRMILSWLNNAKASMEESQFRKCLSDLVHAINEQTRTG